MPSSEYVNDTDIGNPITDDVVDNVQQGGAIGAGSSDVHRLATEWLDTNKSRAYPFEVSTSNTADRIPSPVFTDALFSVTGMSDDAIFYVNRVIQGQTSFQVYVTISDRPTSSWLLADIPYNTPERTQIQVSIDSEDDLSITGMLVVGDLKEIRHMAADTVLDEKSGAFFKGCVRTQGIDSVTGIRVNGRTYTGVVNLVAGEGIAFEVSTDQDTGDTIITVSAKDRVIPDDNRAVTTDEELLGELKNLYGSFVTQINSVSPDDSGNIILAYPDPDSSGVGYTAFSGGSGTIVLQDTQKSTIDCESLLIDTIMNNISELNERGARQAESISALDVANNVMSIALSRLS
jgi:hypothetical protein